MSILNAIPAEYTAGTSLAVRRSSPLYKASEGWVYTLYLRTPQGVTTFGAEADGDGFIVRITPLISQTWQAGACQYSERVEREGEVAEIGSGRLTVRGNVATMGDTRSHAERTLEIIEATIEGRMVDGIQNYSIAGRAVSKIPLTELVKLRGQYRLLVWREQNPGRVSQTVYVSFGGN